MNYILLYGDYETSLDADLFLIHVYLFEVFIGELIYCDSLLLSFYDSKFLGGLILQITFKFEVFKPPYKV
jgi:hypothetical protein